MRIFISYASERRDRAEQLSLSLQQDGHDVFFDREDLPEGESFDGRIRQAIGSCRLFIFLISPESVETGGYTLSELQMCKDRFPDPSGHVLPVVVSETNFERIPNYLRAVTILTPTGNLVAEVAAEVQKLNSARRKRTIKLAAVAAGTLGILLIISGIYFWRRHHAQPTEDPDRIQVVALQAFSMFAEPGQDSAIVRRIAANTEFFLLPKLKTENWARIRLTDGAEGWAMAQDMNYVKSTVKQIDVAKGYGFRGSYWQLYFTSPQPNDQQNENGIDARFALAIDRCEHSLDIAVYELNSPVVTNAIIGANARGVIVRIVTDDRISADARSTFGVLQSKGIPIRTDNSESGLMHNKFAIFDQRTVWTGSWNYTEGATYRNNENAIVLEVPEIAALYTRKFNQMFEEGRFGHRGTVDAPTVAPLPTDMPNGVKVYFAPDDRILDVLRTALSNAKHSIRFMAFQFTLVELSELLKDKARHGVEVRGIFEKSLSQTGSGPVLAQLATATGGDLEVRVDGNPRFLHHDCIIVDDSLVITGSMNFSRSALEINDENLVMLPDQALAAKYNAEFLRLWAVAQKPDPASLVPEEKSAPSNLIPAGKSVPSNQIPAGKSVPPNQIPAERLEHDNLAPSAPPRRIRKALTKSGANGVPSLLRFVAPIGAADRGARC